MASPIRFQTGECWEYQGLRLRFERELGNDLLHFVVERTLAPFQVPDAAGNPIAPTSQWAIEAFAAGLLRRISHRRGASLAQRRAVRPEYDPATAAEIDPSYRLRRFVLRGLDAMGHGSLRAAEIHRALRELWQTAPAEAANFPQKPSPKTVARWLLERGTPGERTTSQLISMAGRVPRARRLPPVTLELLQRAALRYWANPKVSQEDVYARLACIVFRINRFRRATGLQPLSLPSAETLRKEIRRLEGYETYRTKFGEKLAKARFKPTGKGLRAVRILQLGCMDHSLLDGVVVIDADIMLPMGRPWITVLIDVRSRCIVAFVLTYEPPSLYSAMECIKRANRPKIHLAKLQPTFPVLTHIFGRFDEIIVDNGWEFSGNSFEDAMSDLGISVRWAPVAEPTYKAVVERFFGILNHVLNRKLPGGVLPPSILRQMGYDPHKEAVLTISEIEELIWSAISYYHIEEHSMLNCPPASLWKRDVEAHGIDVIGDDEQLHKMAGALKPVCQVTRSGVELFGLRFHEPSATQGLLEDLIGLEPVRGRRAGSATVLAKVKYNPAHLGEIHVWNRRRNVYVTLPCEDHAYGQSVSLWHHRQLQQWTKQQGLEFSSEADRLAARNALMTKIERQAPDLKIRERRAIARLMNSPKVEESLANGHVLVGYAPARHDGLAPIIEHQPLASSRTDQGQPPTRPPRGGSKKSSGGQRANAPQNNAGKNQAPETDADQIDIKSWKGFEL